jgi:hypothetical protein
MSVVVRMDWSLGVDNGLSAKRKPLPVFSPAATPEPQSQFDGIVLCLSLLNASQMPQCPVARPRAQVRRSVRIAAGHKA